MGKTFKVARGSALWGLTLWLGACGSCEGDSGSVEETPETPNATSEAPDNTGHVGTIRGVVRLVEGAEIPEYTLQQAHGPQHAMPWSDECAPPRRVDRTPVRLVEGRALQNVLISATGDPAEFSAALPPSEPVERQVTIEDCRLTPAVLDVTRGDSIVVTNNTDYAFLPTMGDSSFMQALPTGQSLTFEVERGGPQTILCGFAAPCARTDVIALAHPVHATTGEEGTFEMTNVPADQTIQIHAWHLLFQDATVETRVEEGGVTEIVIELRPAEAAPAPEPTEAPEDPVF